MACYKRITDNEFDNELNDILEDMSAIELTNIPGIYEIVAEHFNNDVLDSWFRKQLDKVYAWDKEDIRRLKAILDDYCITSDDIDMCDLPSMPIPDDVDTLYPIWAMDKKGYCLVGDAADQIEHIDSIRGKV